MKKNKIERERKKERERGGKRYQNERRSMNEKEYIDSFSSLSLILFDERFCFLPPSLFLFLFPSFSLWHSPYIYLSNIIDFIMLSSKAMRLLGRRRLRQV